MQFKQAQVRDTIGISVETLRHWKRVLPPFSERKKYTLGDMIAAGVLCHLTEQCGVRAGHLTEISKTIVDICNANGWASLLGKVLIVNLQKKTCTLVNGTRAFSFQDTVIVCPLKGIMAQIQAALSCQQLGGTQRRLQFQSTLVSDGPVQRRRA